MAYQGPNHVNECYEKSAEIIRGVFNEHGIDTTILNAKGYIPDEDGKVGYKRAIFPALPLSLDKFNAVSDAIDELWVQDGSPLRDTTIHISSNEKEPHIATWHSPAVTAK